LGYFLLESVALSRHRCRWAFGEGYELSNGFKLGLGFSGRCAWPEEQDHDRGTRPIFGALRPSSSSFQHSPSMTLNRTLKSLDTANAENQVEHIKIQVIGRRETLDCKTRREKGHSSRACAVVKFYLERRIAILLAGEARS